MSFSVDVPTLLLMTIVAALTMAGVLSTVRPAQREGLGLWSFAMLMHAVANALLLGRGRIPDMLSIVLANVLMAVVLSTTLAAVFRFQGRALPWRLMLAPVAVAAVLYLLFIDDFRVRVVLAGIVPPLQIGLILWSLWHGPRPVVGNGAIMLATGLGLQATFLVARATLALGDQPLQSVLQSNALQALTFLSSFVVVMLVSLGFIVMSRDRADAANHYLATHDALTDVANRRSLLQTMEQGMARAARLREPYSVLMLDVDHFKAVNDTYGHRGGDQVLRQVAHVLQRGVREYDTVGRYGGEEFLVLLPATALPDAVLLARRLREAIALNPCTHESRTIAVTVSIGVSGGFLEPGDSGEMLVQAADQSLYTAKRTGRNRVEAATVQRRTDDAIDNAAT